MRLLSEQLTGTSVREIDALFDDRGVALGPPQPRENDESVRRERMRRQRPPDRADDSDRSMLA